MNDRGSSLVTVLVLLAVITLSLLPFMRNLTFLQLQLRRDIADTSKVIIDRFKEDISCFRTLRSYVAAKSCPSGTALTLRDHNDYALAGMGWKATCDSRGTGIVIDTGDDESITICENWLSDSFVRFLTQTGSFSVDATRSFNHRITVPFVPSAVQCGATNFSYEGDDESVGRSNTCSCNSDQAVFSNNAVEIPVQVDKRTRWPCNFSYLVLGKKP